MGNAMYTYSTYIQQHYHVYDISISIRAAIELK